MMTETFTSKIGTARQIPGSRVWIEGARLVRAGFVVGARYTLSEDYWSQCHAGELVLALTPEGKRRVSGKGDKPIIDITGETIRRVFARRPSVLVEYGVGTIRIS